MFVPDKISVPAPALVKFPEPVITPPYVNVFVLATSIVLVVDEFKVIPLFVAKVKSSVVAKVPPFNVILVAVTDAGAAPKLRSAETLKVPALIVLIPV